MAKEEKEGMRWEPFAAIGCGMLLWVLGFDQKWFAFGPWTKGFPTYYPPPQKDFLIGVALTGLALGWSFSAIRHASILSKIIGWLGFAYFYLHVITLGYMADPDLFIWKLFPQP